MSNVQRNRRRPEVAGAWRGQDRGTEEPLMVRNMNAVRRSILRQLLLRMERMKRGFTFIERDRNGATVEDAALEPFNSFAECCAAAERALSAGSARLLERIEVVPCRYDESWCRPDAMFVMKTFRRTAL